MSQGKASFLGSVMALMRKRLNELQADVPEHFTSCMRRLRLLISGVPFGSGEDIFNSAHERLQAGWTVVPRLSENLSQHVHDQDLMHGGARLKDGDIILGHLPGSIFLREETASTTADHKTRADKALPDIKPTFRLRLGEHTPGGESFSWKDVDLSGRGF